ncbi:hypothetical protein M501DRAFT_992840 [Patellaria atrata CBS 101060]|uniref:Uncharacterized protein n=1 Tax=Patellaria atrata CBS 101060 TaxID=1346257 RepID=A0A9P4SAK3_9PEZI|nr:hypothetical protein M501DRAFT_992840 [Patellaria atrata CBS 101060]
MNHNNIAHEPYRGIFRDFQQAKNEAPIFQPRWKPPLSPFDDTTFPFTAESYNNCVKLLYNAMINIERVAEHPDDNAHKRWTNPRFYDNKDIEAMAHELVSLTIQLHNTGAQVPEHMDRTSPTSACRSWDFGTRLQKLAKLLEQRKRSCEEIMARQKLWKNIIDPDACAQTARSNKKTNAVKGTQLKYFRQLEREGRLPGGAPIQVLSQGPTFDDRETPRSLVSAHGTDVYQVDISHDFEHLARGHYQVPQQKIGTVNAHSVGQGYVLPPSGQNLLFSERFRGAQRPLPSDQTAVQDGTFWTTFPDVHGSMLAGSNSTMLEDGSALLAPAMGNSDFNGYPQTFKGS